MYFDPVNFTYGVGLVMVGWTAGMVLGIALKLFRSVDRLA